MSLAPYVHVPGAVLVAGERLAIDADTRHHLERVKRLRDGAEVVVADGVAGEAPARLEGGALHVVGPAEDRPAATPRVVLWQAVGRGGRTEDAVRMCTEAGVAAVELVLAGRTVRQPAAAAQEKLRGRCEAVAASAAAQCRRPSLVRVDGPTALVPLLDGLARPGAGERRAPLLLVLDHRGEVLRAGTGPAVLVAEAEDVVLAVGPEGGWSPDERTAFEEAGGHAVGLPTHVLRTEHAGMAALVAVRALSV